MSSSRFPKKMLASLCGTPLAVFVCQRAARAKKVDVVVLATSAEPEDTPLADAVAAAGFPVFRGSLEDVLERFAGAARSVKADTVVRVTGDCPLVDATLLDEMLAHFSEGGFDYYMNFSPPMFPDGLDLEIMRMDKLEEVAKEARPGHQREHVTPFFRDHPERFKLGNELSKFGNHAHYHWSVDLASDLAIVQDVLDASGDRWATLEDHLKALATRPELIARSSAKQRNEGAVKSLLEDLEAQQARPKNEVAGKLEARRAVLAPSRADSVQHPDTWVGGFGPSYFASGDGAYVVDSDGERYLDLWLDGGQLLLGHGLSQSGFVSPALSAMELEVAEAIQKLVGLEVQCAFAPDEDALVLPDEDRAGGPTLRVTRTSRGLMVPTVRAALADGSAVIIGRGWANGAPFAAWISPRPSPAVGRSRPIGVAALDAARATLAALPGLDTHRAALSKTFFEGVTALSDRFGLADAVRFARGADHAIDVIATSPAINAFVRQELARRRTLIGPRIHFGAPHTPEHVSSTLAAFAATFRALRFVVDSSITDVVLLGRPPTA